MPGGQGPGSTLLRSCNATGEACCWGSQLLVRILSAALEAVAAAADVVRLASVCEDFRSIILELTPHVRLPRGAGHASTLQRARRAVTSLRRCLPGKGLVHCVC